MKVSLIINTVFHLVTTIVITGYELQLLQQNYIKLSIQITS